MGEKVSQIEKDGLSGLTTGNITVSLDGAGSLRITGAEGEVTSQQGAGNFTLYMDLTTDEVFDTRLEFRELTRLSSSEGTRGEVRFTDVDGGKRMETSFVFTLQEGNVTVRQQIELRDYASEAEITYSIENGCTGSTVVALVAGQLLSLIHIWDIHVRKIVAVCKIEVQMRLYERLAADGLKGMRHARREQNEVVFLCNIFFPFNSQFEFSLFDEQDLMVEYLPEGQDPMQRHRVRHRPPYAKRIFPQIFHRDHVPPLPFVFS